MRFAMIVPTGAIDTIGRRFRADLDLFNIELVRLEPLAVTASMEPKGAVADYLESVLNVLAFEGPWDGVLLSCADEDRSDELVAAGVWLRQLASRVRRILGPNVPVGVLDHVAVDASQQLFDGVMRLWLMRAVALDSDDRTAEL